ncbi:MAG TPA: protease pro-enzyme activation domain-containing protein [Candidatus Elarobacter sp.]
MKIRLIALTLATGLAATACGGGVSHLLPNGISNGASGVTRSTRSAVVAPAGWATTATLGAVIPSATDKGALAATTPMTVRVGLNLHNEQALASLIASRQTISPSQFDAQFGPTSSEVQQVVSYLTGQGFTNVTTSAQLVSANGTAATVAKAFNTSLEAYTLNGQSVYVNTQPAFVPASLGGIVSAVLGLNNAAKMSVTPKRTTPGAISCFPQTLPNGSCIPVFDAGSVQKFYDAGGTAAATGTTIAVIAEGNVSGTVSDLRYAETQQGLPQVPVSVVTVGLPSADTAGAAEWDLDTQSSTGMAGNVKMLYIYATTSLTDSDIANNYSHWVGAHVAQLGNSSFGECEYQAFLDGSMKVDDHLFMQGAAQGQTMFVSTGDTGSSCALAPTNGAPGSGPPMVEYPAASSYAVGVGGTTVVANGDASYSGEAAWNAGGGGLSQFENSTSWQQATIPTSTGAAATNLRGLPDIAMAADANAGAYNVYGQNIPGVGACPSGCGIGGTSEASPLAMGSYARLLTAHPTLGFAAPQFYQNFLENQNSTSTVNGPPPTQTLGGYHDIITGANGAYTALPGYDYTTGLGTLDITVMSSQIGH